MKKEILLLVSFTLFVFNLNSQTIVGTTPENKNVILEEFTGIHCGYCPQGHAIAQGIQDNNPGDVFLINIHTGGYSTPSSGEPDFRTIFGTAIAGQSGLTGYPSGTVNRHFFSNWTMGSGTAMSRSNWSNASNQILGESSYVNVAVEAEIDVASRELIVHVEAYYTGDSPVTSNFLNVALLQNNTLGPQAGGNLGDEYVHMHRLVWMITGQWGEEITTTTTGTFVDKTYTYTLPIDYNDVDVVIPNMEIVAFLTETTQEIPSGSGCIPTYIVANDNDAGIVEVTAQETSCGAPLSPVVTISNGGNNDITSLDINYSINGETIETYTWTGSLATFGTEDIILPAIPFTLETNNIINISITDDDNNTNNTGSASFGVAPETSHVLSLILNTASSGSGCTWNVKDYNGAILYSGGPYSNNQTITETFHLIPDCYEFNVMNSDGNGGGSITLSDAEETIVYHSTGQYGYGESQAFSTFTSAPLVSFNPENGSDNIPLNSNILLLFNEPVRMVDNSLITDPSSFISIKTVPYQTVINFSASINNDNNLITVIPDENLPENSYINVNISGSSIENFYDNEFESTSATFQTEEGNSIIDISGKSFISPNPTKEYFQISEFIKGKIIILDITGKQLFSQNIVSENEQINIGNLSPGIYIVKVITDNGIFTNKIIKN